LHLLVVDRWTLPSGANEWGPLNYRLTMGLSFLYFSACPVGVGGGLWVGYGPNGSRPWLSLPGG